jgi:mono/diheme cytochrome c family protein
MGGGHVLFRLMTGTFGVACASGMALGAVLIQTVWGTEMAAIPPAAKREVDFIKDIQPLFKDHCYKCHGSSRQEGGLRLDRRDDALNGGDGGPVLLVGKSEESKLIKYVAAVDPDVVMPPEGDKLSDEKIGLLRAWIDQGAKWPKD